MSVVNTILMLRRPRSARGGAAILALLLTAVAAASVHAGSRITIRDAWARAPAVPGQNGAAYMTLVNDGATERRLVGVATEASARAELHRSVTDDGVMKMMPKDAIVVPADGRAVLEPGGFHIMLMGANESVKAGGTIPLTLRFADGATRRVTAQVVGPGRTPEMAE